VSRLITIIGFCAWGLAALAVELAARLNPERLAPLGELLGTVLASRPARVVIVLFWWWLGWHFLVAPPEDFWLLG
jgi:hypothetical protein